MKRVWICLVAAVIVCGMGIGNSRLTAAAAGSATDQAAVRKVLDDQTAAWNRGDIDAFMTGLLEFGQRSICEWKRNYARLCDVLARYKKGFPTQAAMGQLSFTGLEIHVECADSAYVIGQFHLALSAQ